MKSSFSMNRESYAIGSKNILFQLKNTSMIKSLAFVMILLGTFFVSGCDGNATDEKTTDSIAQKNRQNNIYADPTGGNPANKSPKDSGCCGGKSKDSASQSNIHNGDARGGVEMIHQGMDLAKSGKELMDKGEAAKDKAMMQRGIEMMDKGMDIIGMGKQMSKKDTVAMASKGMADDMGMVDKGMDKMNMGKDTASKAMSPSDKPMMEKGMDMMDKGMDMMEMGAAKMKKDKKPMPKKDPPMKDGDM